MKKTRVLSFGMKQMGDSATRDDIRKQLFENENVVTDINTDKGLSNLQMNQDSSKKED